MIFAIAHVPVCFLISLKCGIRVQLKEGCNKESKIDTAKYTMIKA